MASSKLENALQFSALLGAATFFVFVLNRQNKVVKRIPVPEDVVEALLDERLTPQAIDLGFTLFDDIKTSPQHPS